jgi:hypothetical protein
MIELILWIAVSILCLRCTNKDKDAEAEWETTDLWIKVLVFLGMPIIYIMTAAVEAYKK